MRSAPLPVAVLRRTESGRVGTVELFFDLVYVLTIIQLSHFLLHDLSPHGALEALILFAAVWWGWNYSAWAMNWLDPDHPGVRLLVVSLMLAALTMAIAIPDAFGDRALLFVAGYLFLQLVRSAFMVVAFRGQLMARNYAQLLAWSVGSGVLWVAGALADDEARLYWWIAAVVVDYAAPIVGFYLPRLGASSMQDWPLTEEHLAERCRLVFIIALGESILILGGVLADAELDAGTTIAGIVGFSSIVLLWWLYFSPRHGNVEKETPLHASSAAIGRAAYTYGHAFMVGGAIVVAVGIELVTTHPGDSASWAAVLTILGGPAIYLVGNIIFNESRNQQIPASRVAALSAFIAAGAIVLVLGAPYLVVALAALGILLATGAVTKELWERPVHH
ncbi:low temperature requirement protein A [Lolliginicoccus suaedae]|uniref:low temperature requirement protein A n=1 Tax=Lolliginicoccus suaedae TaxID=2605429 RepID=UPI0011ED29FA|nr:low temperature requirement protein A [Lolliginicoccus suaedae]